jgi:hypothetical protein
MNKFQKGDRVACYFGLEGEGAKRWTGTVDYAKEDYVQVTTDDGVAGRGLHPKQCRKLVKKKRNRIWVKPEFLKSALDKLFDENKNYCLAKYPAPDTYWTEFVEVKKK